LPVPLVRRREDGTYFLDSDVPHSIGRVHAFYGNFLVMVRAYTYILMQGADGLRSVSENAVINANYVMRKLEKAYENPFPDGCMHDFGIHAPTVYFPLIVPEALMIEPTETESKESLDRFVEAMISIAEEAEKNPQVLRDAPHTTPVRRLDEARAAHPKTICLSWRAFCAQEAEREGK
ncbi:MAG: aminomethyl-transferring glycine dehydrogenase subunit GcvPB, partial [Candidatus Bathyarchaeia archaeon]